MSLNEKLSNVFLDDLFNPPSLRKTYQVFSLVLCEFFGTFFFMTFGCLDSVEDGSAETAPGILFPNALETSLAWSMGFGAVLVCTAHISGCFLNPALTVLMVLIGEMSIYRMLIYSASQIAGSILAVVMITQTFDNLSDDFCVSASHDSLSRGSALFLEVWASFALGLLFCSVYDPRTRNNFNFAPAKFAFGSLALYLPILKFTGCSMNPARSLGPAIIANNFNNIWIYMLGPLIGVAAAAVLYLLCFHHSIFEGDKAAVEAPPEP